MHLKRPTAERKIFTQTRLFSKHVAKGRLLGSSGEVLFELSKEEREVKIQPMN